MLIYVDNYNEVMETVEEIRRPVLVALIDRRLNAFAMELEAVHRKFEKDKFLIILSIDKLNAMKEGKFEILSQVRGIEIGNTLPVTLSIGIGTGGKNLAQSMDFAQEAIDLALGRGGDQALIKDGETYIFYGGGSAEVQPKPGVTARIKLHTLAELVDAARSVVIMGHKRIDFDCLGAAVGVLKIAAQRGAECRVVMGECGGVMSIYADLMKEPEYAGVFISAEEALRYAGADTLTVIVDANRISIVECPDLLNITGRLAVIDHHRLSTDFINNASLTYQEPYASSTCELICEMMKHTKEHIKLKPVEADLMLAGITVDTKNFTQKTGAKTFDAAAYLRRNGADGIRIKTYLQESPRDIIATARAVAEAELNGGFAISVCKDPDNPAQTSARAADELMNIAGVTASFVLAGMDGGTYVSARSYGHVNVQLLMEQLGGGGHRTMAGAAVSASPDEIIKTIKHMIFGDGGDS